MSGECEKCGEHALDCKCIVFAKSEPVHISINKEYLRKEFSKVLSRYDIDEDKKKELLDDLLNTIARKG